VADVLGLPIRRLQGFLQTSHFQGFLTDVSGQPIDKILIVILPTFRGILSVPYSRISCRRFGTPYRYNLKGFLTDVSGHPIGIFFKYFYRRFGTFRYILQGFLPAFRYILSVKSSRTFTDDSGHPIGTIFLRFVPTFRDIISVHSSRIFTDVSGHPIGKIFKDFFTDVLGNLMGSLFQGFITDVAGHSVGPIFKDFLQTLQDSLSVLSSRTILDP